MWHDSYSTEKLDEVDTTSSRDWVYLRKNFEYIEGSDDTDGYWHYLEKIISKENWELYQLIKNHDLALDDIYDALAELAEMIVGVEE